MKYGNNVLWLSGKLDIIQDRVIGKRPLTLHSHGHVEHDRENLSWHRRNNGYSLKGMGCPG